MNYGWSRQRAVKPEDIEATIYSAMGVNWTTVRYDDPLGRGLYSPIPTRTCSDRLMNSGSRKLPAIDVAAVSAITKMSYPSVAPAFRWDAQSRW